MSNFEKNWMDVGLSATETAVNVVWNQWAELGSMARKTSQNSSNLVIDPEALVLTSVALQSEERRLTDALHWWAKSGTSLMSIQRMRKLEKKAGGTFQDCFAEFAILASEYGHRSWKRFANQGTERSTSTTQFNNKLELRGASNLLLRMRAGFGVGVKSDVLCFLISSPHSYETVPEIAEHLGYTNKAIRDSLKDMTAAGLIADSTGRPVNYSTNQTAWIELLHPELTSKSDLPQWALWSSFLPFLISAIELCTAAVSGNISHYVSSSYARDLVENHQRAFKYHQIKMPNAADFPGRDYIIAFSQVVSELSNWTQSRG